MAFFGRPSVVRAAGALCAAALSITAAASQESKSASVAKELVQALDAAKLTDIAAPDPGNPGAFIAALYIPGTQLLVVSAKYSAPRLMVDRITARDFMGVYVDLQSASVRGTKVFIQDQGADGLNARPGSDGPADLWEEGDKSVATGRRPRSPSPTTPRITRMRTNVTRRCSRRSSPRPNRSRGSRVRRRSQEVHLRCCAATVDILRLIIGLALVDHPKLA